MSRRREQARILLTHYLKLALTREPDEINLDGDCESEMDEIADLIIEAAVEEAVIEVESRFNVSRRKHSAEKEKLKQAEEAASANT